MPSIGTWEGGSRCGCALSCSTDRGAIVELVAVRTDPAVRENQVLRELVAIYHHLTGLALQSADLQAVAGLLAERVGEQVGVVGPTLDVLAAAGPEQTP